LAHSGLTSRRKAEDLIKEGRVKINGIIVCDLSYQVNPDTDQVLVDNKQIARESKIYLILNKPSGYICSVHDPQGRPTVMDLVTDIKERIYPVGRLDYDTEGLLLMTNDGEFANLMLHPRYKISKTYHAWVQGYVQESAINLLKKGILLKDGRTAPAKVILLKRDKQQTLLKITIHEGRKRQVKRMCTAVGHPVLKLKRTAFSSLTLKGLHTGNYRFIQPEEINMLIKKVK